VAGLGKGKPSRVYTEVFDEADSVNVEGRSEPGSQTLQLYDVVLLAHHFGASRLSALYRLRNLRLVSEAEFETLKAQDDAGKGSQLAKLLGLPEPDHAEIRNEFQHRFLGLALEAFRREEISRGKLKELAALAEITDDDFDQLVEGAGIDASDSPEHLQR
jgi:hypothetical protein